MSLALYHSFVLITVTIFASFIDIYNSGLAFDHLTCNTLPSKLKAFTTFKVLVSIFLMLERFD